MKKEQFFRLSVLAVLSMLVLACQAVGLGGNATPYLTPTAGEWRGEDGGFTLLESGEISNLHWSLNADGSEYARCPIGLNEYLAVADGMADLTFTRKETGEIAFTLKIVFNSATTATLTYQYDFCPSTRSITFDTEGNVWIYSGEAKLELMQP